jgi:hypothetical protein
MEPITVSQLIDRSRRDELIVKLTQMIEEQGYIEGHQLAEITALDDRACQMVVQALAAIFAAESSPTRAQEILSQLERYSWNHLEYGKGNARATAEVIAEHLWQMASNIRNNSQV